MPSWSGKRQNSGSDWHKGGSWKHRKLCSFTQAPLFTGHRSVLVRAWGWGPCLSWLWRKNLKRGSQVKGGCRVSLNPAILLFLQEEAASTLIYCSSRPAPVFLPWRRLCGCSEKPPSCNSRKEPSQLAPWSWESFILQFIHEKINFSFLSALDGNISLWQPKKINAGGSQVLLFNSQHSACDRRHLQWLEGKRGEGE